MKSLRDYRFPLTDSAKLDKLCKALMGKFGAAKSIPEETITKAIEKLFPHYDEEESQDAMEYVKGSCLESETEGISEDQGKKIWSPIPSVATALEAWNTARSALIKLNAAYKADTAPFQRAPDAEPMSAGNMKRLKDLQSRHALESEKAMETYTKATSALIEALKEEITRSES